MTKKILSLALSLCMLLSFNAAADFSLHLLQMKTAVHAE